MLRDNRGERPSSGGCQGWWHLSYLKEKIENGSDEGGKGHSERESSAWAMLLKGESVWGIRSI